MQRSTQWLQGAQILWPLNKTRSSPLHHQGWQLVGGVCVDTPCLFFTECGVVDYGQTPPLWSCLSRVPYSTRVWWFVQMQLFNTWRLANCQSFCFYRDGYTHRWSVNPVYLINSTWLLFRLLFLLTASLAYIFAKIWKASNTLTWHAQCAKTMLLVLLCVV